MEKSQNWPIENWCNRNNKAQGSFNVTLFSDTHTLNLSLLILNFQFVGVAKEGNIKRAPGFTIIRKVGPWGKSVGPTFLIIVLFMLSHFLDFWLFSANFEIEFV